MGRGDYAWDEWALSRLNIEFAQIDMAIGVLVVHGRINCIDLHRFHLAVRHYARSLTEIVWDEPTWERMRYPPDPDRHFGLSRIQGTIDSLLTGDDELKNWNQLGQVVGDYLSLFEDIIYGNIGLTPGSIVGQASQVLAIGRDLIARSEYSLPQGIMTLLEEYSKNWPADPGDFGPGSGAHLCWLDIARLDIAILLESQEKTMSDPWLVLDREQVTLFGKPIPSNRKTRQNIACPWLLAENACQPVRRELIGETVGSQRFPWEMQYVLTSTRKLLNPIIAAHFSETGLELPLHANKAFIVEGKPDPIN